MSDRMTPEKLKTIRNALGLSQQQLAIKLGYKFKQQIDFLESDKRPIPEVITPALKRMIVDHIKKLQKLEKSC